MLHTGSVLNQGQEPRAVCTSGLQEHSGAMTGDGKTMARADHA